MLIDIMELPFVSIIIPTWRHNKVLKQCVDSLLNLDYPADSVEIILLSKERLQLIPHARVQQIRVGQGVNYVHARNIGVTRSRGELIAFLDDDVIAPPDWLKKAVSYFSTSNIALLGGPAVPFREEPFCYRVGGYLFSSPFAVGAVSLRYKAYNKSFETKGEHLIMANNFVTKHAFNAVRGLYVDQAPCEDGYFYFRLREKGYRLMYAPDIFVWHRAKPIIIPVISKVFYYALGRGGVMARDARSIRLMYLVPTVFLLIFFVLALLSFVSLKFFYAFLTLTALYLVLNSINAFYIYFAFERSVLVALASFISTPLMHGSYGLGIVYGVYTYFRGGFRRGGVSMWNKY